MKTIINKKRQLIKTYVFLIVFLPIISFMFLKNLDLFLKFLELKKEKNSLIERVIIKEKQEKVFNQDLQKLNKESEQDKILLEKFPLYKPGEKVIEILK